MAEGPLKSIATLLAAACLLGPAAASGQGTLEVGVHAGLSSFSRSVDIVGRRLGAGIPPVTLRVVNLSLAPAVAPTFGLHAALRVRPALALRLDASVTPTRLELEGISGVPGDSATAGNTLGRLEGTGGLGEVLATSVGLEAVLGGGRGPGALRPFAALGLALAHEAMWDLEDLHFMAPFTGVELAETESRHRLGFGASLAVGTELHLARRTVRLELRDRITSNPWDASDFRAITGFFGSADPDAAVHHVEARVGVLLRGSPR